MNITPTKQEWIYNYLRTYHKPPYTPLKIKEAEAQYENKFKKESLLQEK
jgi:hypothetical protein